MGKKYNAGLSDSFIKKLGQTIQEKAEEAASNAFDKAGEEKYKIKVDNVEVDVTDQVKEKLAKNIKNKLDGTEVSPEIKVTPEIKTDADTEKKMKAYIKGAAPDEVTLDTKIGLSEDAFKSFTDKLIAKAKEAKLEYKDIFNIVSEVSKLIPQFQKHSVKLVDVPYTDFDGTWSNYGISIKDTNNIEDVQKALTEVYKLYKNIQGAIKNSGGIFKNETYNNHDLENLKGIFGILVTYLDELGVDSTEFVSTIPRITKEFKTLTSETIETYKHAREIDAIWEKEDEALDKANEPLVERVRILKQILELAAGDDWNRQYAARKPLGDTWDYENEDFEINNIEETVKRIAKVLGIDIPDAAKKASDATTEHSESMEKEAKSAKEDADAQEKLNEAQEKQTSNNTAEESKKASDAKEEETKSTEKVADAIGEETKAHEKNTDAIKKENQARKDSVEKSPEHGYLRRESGAEDSPHGYTEKINDFINKQVTPVKDKEGNLSYISKYLFDYDKALSSITSLDEKIIKQIHDIKNATEEEAAPMLTNLHLLESQRKEAEDWVKAMVADPDTEVNQSQLDTLTKVRESKREQLQAELRIKDAKAETVRLEKEEIQAAKEKANVENAERQAIADSYYKEELEYLSQREKYLEEGKQQLAEYIRQQDKLRKQKEAEYTNIFFGGNGKLKDVEIASDTEALNSSNNLYDTMKTYLEEIYDLKEKNLQIDKETNVGQDEIAKNEASIADLAQKTVAIRKEISESEAIQVSRENELLELHQKRNVALKEIQQHNESQSRDDMAASVSKWITKLEKLQEIGKYTSSFSAELVKAIDDLNKFDASSGSIDEVTAAFEKLENTVKNIDFGKQLSKNKLAAEASISKLNLQIEEFERKNSRMGANFRKQFEALKIEWDAEQSVEGVAKLVAQFNKLKVAVTQADKLGASFFDTLRQRAMGVNAQLIAQYLSWQDIIRYIREAVVVIKDLDDALVDLKKTTAMDNTELKEFYFNANNIAKEMGVTTDEIINQASSWSRLGYNTKEASEMMAQLSSQFASISPGMGVEEAQTGLVSIMKAWNVDVEKVERDVMDNINTLGNKFAETNSDIIEGMERAGATLSAIGMSIEDSFALFTGAQEVIQNAETVGTALKTLSLRIRGYDEETEELSDDVIAATGKVADLTKVASNNFAGVSLWADAEQTKYRSLTEYLGDIAKIWDEIDAKSQTDLLNNLFGKRGASVGSAILKNFGQIEKALEEMENAAGSADREMDIIKESISYKLNALKQTWVGVLQELIDSGKLGKLIDALTTISEALGKIITAQGPTLSFIEALGLSSLILNLDKIPDLLGSLTKNLADISSAEMHLGETSDAINAIGASSVDATLAVNGLKKALLAVAQSPITWIAGAIAVGAIAWDKFTVTVEESQEEIDKTKEKIEGINTEIKTLEELGDNRTTTQEYRLEQLRNELDLQERILAIEQKRYYAEQYGRKFSDLFDKDNYNAQITSEYNKNSQESVINRIAAYNSTTSKISQKTRLKSKYESRLAELQGMDTSKMSALSKITLEKEIDRVTLKIGKLQDEIDDLSDTKLTIKGDLYSKIEDYQAIIDSTQVLIDSGALKGTALSDAKQVIADAQQIIDWIANNGVRQYGLADKLENNISHIAGHNTEERKKLENATKDLTTEEIKLWLEATEGARSADEAIQRYNDALGETSEEIAKAISESPSSIADSVEGINTRLKAQFDELGSLYQNIFYGDDGFSLKDIDNDALKGIVDNFTQFNEELGLTAEEEEHVKDVADSFMKTLTDEASTADDVQKAFNDIATAYFYSADGLKELNENTANAIKQQLEQMGITNADNIVQYYLNLSVNKMSEDEAKQALKAIGIDDPTQSQIDYYIQLHFDTDYQSTKTKLDELYSEMDKLGEGGGVELRLRPTIDANELNKVGWDAGEGVATVFSSTFSNEAGDVAINITPIVADENGNVIEILSPEELEEYANGLLSGLPDDKHIQIGMAFTGEDAIEKASDAAERIHEIQDVFYNLNLDTIFGDFGEEMQLIWADFEEGFANGAETLERIKETIGEGFQTEALEYYSELIGVTTQQLADFLFKEQMVNSASIDTSQECAALLALAGDAKYTEEVYQKLLELLEIYTGIESGVYGQGTQDRAMALERANQIKREIDALMAEGPEDVDFVPKNTTKAASGAGKEAGDAYVEAFEKELEALEEQRDAGIIGETEFLEKYRDLIEKYFKDVDGYGDEYSKRMADYWDRTISHMENVVSAIGKLLDKKISAAQEGKDAAISALEEEKEAAHNAYQAQIDAIQEQIDAIDDQIDALDKEIDKINDEIDVYQKQIDAINKANEAREHSMALQKAQYELERSLNQRTRLVYTGDVGQMRYERDESAVRSAQESVNEAEDQLAIDAIQKQIDLLEEEIDLIEKQKDALKEQQEELKKQQEAIQKMMDASDEYYDKLIKQQEEYWDKLISALEKQKSKWEELIEQKEIAEAFALIQETMRELGYTVDDVLNDTPGAFEAFRDAYLNALVESKNGNDDFLDGLAYATGQAKEKFGELASAAEGISESTEPLAESADDVKKFGDAASTAAEGVGKLKEAVSGITSDGVCPAECIDKLNNANFDGLTTSIGELKTNLEAISKLIAGEDGSIESALQALNNPEILSELGKAFENLYNSVVNVCTALGVDAGGSGGEGESDSTNSKSRSMSEGSGEGEGTGLIQALEAVKTAADTFIGMSPDEEGETTIGRFNLLKKAVDAVSQVIGTAEDEGGEGEGETTLIGAINDLYVKTNEALYGGGEGGNGAINAFNELAEAIGACAAAASELLGSIQAIGEIDFSNFGSFFEGGGSGGKSKPSFPSGGTIVYTGTANYDGDWRVGKNEKSLVGELGPEVVLHNGKYTVVGKDGPEFVQLHKDDIVLNHKQTKAILDKKNQVRALADGSILTPLSSAALNVQGRIQQGFRNAIPDLEGIQKIMQQQTKDLSAVIQKNNTPNITITNPQFTCTGVSGEQVMRQIEGAFEGLMLNAYQRAMS